MEKFFSDLFSFDLMSAAFAISALFGLIPATLSLLKTTSRAKKVSRESTELYKTLRENRQIESIKTIESATVKLPSGLSKDEYFGELKSILSELSYTQLKSTDDNTKDNVVENLIRNHHEQAILQASVQFWFSLIASVVGFIFIIAMIVMANNSQWYEYVFRILPGVVIETVSFLFFKQSSETRERASDFLNRLQNDDQIAKGIVIADSIDDEALKSNIKAQIALHICGISELHIKNDTA